MRTTFKKFTGTLLMSAALASTTACGRNVDLSDIIPEDKAVSINVPGQGGGQALLGARSDLYETTYNISRGVNGTVGFVLGLSRAISQQRPTSQEGDTYVWGPSEPNGLERISYKFTANKIEEGHYTFQLEGRPKGSSNDGDWKVIYDGDVTRGEANPRRGHGTLNLYFDNSQALEQKTCGNGNRDVLEGRAAIRFAADAEPKTLDVDFVDFRNTCDGESVTRQPAQYRYTEATDGAGNFQFSAHGNIHKANENKPLLEKMTIRSRWQGDGQGRSDVTVGEGEVPGDLTANNISGNSLIVTECWDAAFNVVFQTTEPNELPQALKDAIRPTEGTESACAYTVAELPSDI